MLAASTQPAAEPAGGGPAVPLTVPANRVAELALVSGAIYQNPFMEVELDAIVTPPDGKPLRVPAFWAGGNRWCFRYASATPGVHTWRSECSDTSNAALHGIAGKIEVTSATGDNPLYRHGPLRVAKDKRYFEHADGTPFFWLGDTWWKGLCKRLTWQGFQELTADRKSKGFTLVQIVCGPYPDEGMFEPRWENEGGMPYETKDFSVVNPEYFEYADQRIQYLVEQGIVPAIVGGWGREQTGGMSTISLVGADGYKRHWRHLVARYGAYPAVWIAGGEASDRQGPWGEVLKHLKEVDPYRHLLTYHAPGNPRQLIRDNVVCDFDMVSLGHESIVTAEQTLEIVRSCLAQAPTRPALSGEACYEGHMQNNFQDLQRHMFWSFMLSGAAGHTYGAAGIWHSGVDGDPGITPVYDWTTWQEGMNYPGSTQIGLGKKLLEKYPWSRFETHPEWAEAGCYAAGIPGEVCFIYLPRRRPYDWSGPVVRNLVPGCAWQIYYFDPASGRKFEQGTCVFAGPEQPPFVGHMQPNLVPDRCDATDAASCNDYGTLSQCEQGRLAGGQGMLPVVEAFQAPVPTPQDWVLVLERVKQ